MMELVFQDQWLIEKLILKTLKTCLVKEYNIVLVHFLKRPKIVLGHPSPGYISQNTHEWRRINLLLSLEKVQKYFFSCWKQGKGWTVSQCVDLAPSASTLKCQGGFINPLYAQKKSHLPLDTLISTTVFLSYEIPQEAKVSGVWGRGGRGCSNFICKKSCK